MRIIYESDEEKTGGDHLDLLLSKELRNAILNASEEDLRALFGDKEFESLAARGHAAAQRALAEYDKKTEVKRYTASAIHSYEGHHSFPIKAPYTWPKRLVSEEDYDAERAARVKAEEIKGHWKKNSNDAVQLMNYWRQRLDDAREMVGLKAYGKYRELEAENKRRDDQIGYLERKLKRIHTTTIEPGLEVMVRINRINTLSGFDRFLSDQEAT